MLFTSLVEFLNMSGSRQNPAQSRLTGSSQLLLSLLSKLNLYFSVTISWRGHENRVSRPHLPVLWHQALPIWLRQKPWPRNSYLLWGHFIVDNSRLLVRICGHSKNVFAQIRSAISPWCFEVFAYYTISVPTYNISRFLFRCIVHFQEWHLEHFNDYSNGIAQWHSQALPTISK